MFSPHSSCIPPDNEEIKIWKYMDLTKLLSILETHCLWFSNVTALEDPLEGFLNRATVKALRNIPKDLPILEYTKKQMTVEANLKVMKEARDFLNVCSWHMSDYESAAMWQLYLKNNDGIAIQSTFKRLRDSIIDPDIEVNIGVIKYVDEDTEIINWTNIFDYALHKRKSFEHEKELRAVVLSRVDNSGGEVQVDLAKLIERIFIAPNASNWTFELIKKIIKRYGLKEDLLEQSKLYESPLY